MKPIWQDKYLLAFQPLILIALACGEAPRGHARWTLRLLADQMVALEYVDTVSHEAVRQTLKKTS